MEEKCQNWGEHNKWYMYHHHITVNVNNNFLSSPPFWHFSSIPTLHNHLMVTHTDFLWIHYDFLSAPPFWHFSSILTFGQTPQKWPILAPKKVNVRPAEKSHSPNPYWYGLFAKKRVQIGQIWPLWPNIHFTGPYRGSPPCTLSQHPNSRETGYSNVLISYKIVHQMAPLALVANLATRWRHLH